MGGKSSKDVAPTVKEEKVQDVIDFSKLFKPKEEVVSTNSSPVETVLKPKGKKQQAVRNTAIVALFGYILYRALEPVVGPKLRGEDDKRPKPKTTKTEIRDPSTSTNTTTTRTVTTS